MESACSMMGYAKTKSPLVAVLFLIFSPSILMAGPLLQQAGPDNLVVMETSNNDGNTPQGTATWTVVGAPVGFSGANAHQALPTNAANVTTGFATGSPRLDYQINFGQAGTHYVWLHGRGDASNSNSIHIGINGAEVALANQSLHFTSGVGWEWSSTRAAGVLATIEVPAAGVHTLNIWMRESGVYVDRVLVTTNAAYIPTGLEAESLRSGGTSLFEDNFDDGDALGWSVVDNCLKGTTNWLWVNNAYMQAGECRGFSVEGAAIASYATSSVALPADVDIRLRMRSEDPALDAVASNNASVWKFDTMGLLFGYQDNNNYYRFELDGNKGHRKLWRVQAGVFTELAASPQSFVAGQWVDIRVVFQNGLILISVDGQQVMTVADTTFASGNIALFCARNSSCSFDDIIVVGAPASPTIGFNVVDGLAHASSEYFVDTNAILDVAAFTTVSAAIGGVEFVADEGTVNEIIQTDITAPYTSQFTLTTGEHAISAHLLDAAVVRLAAPEASITLPQIGTGGIHLVCLGDSITNGHVDDFTLDDVSFDMRNTGGGYAPILNNYLSADNGIPVTVLNDGNPGEESWEGAARISAVTTRTPAAQAYLVSYGANDSGGTLPTPSGLGLISGQAGYAGSFKDNLQQIIDAASSVSRPIVLAKAPPYLASATRDAIVAEYNQVVDQLVSENGFTYTPPDFYSYFTANPGEFNADGIHPNGVGYQSMALFWCDGLNGQLNLSCVDADGDGLSNLLEAGIGTDPFLDDTDGDGLTDFEEVAFDGDASSYTPGVDPDPLVDDTDGDGLLDGVDPIPLNFNLADGDLAPLGAPDGLVNAGDYVVALRIVLGEITPTALELAHADLYPPGAPDGQINLQDLMLLQVP